MKKNANNMQENYNIIKQYWILNKDLTLGWSPWNYT